MSAKEMFKKLGYKRKRKGYDRNYMAYCKDNLEIKIIFDLEEKTFLKKYRYGSMSIKLDELKAINKQIEELGWLDKEE